MEADDLTVLPAEVLYRRIPHWHVVFDKNTGQHRPSTAAFEDYEMSVNMDSILTAHGLDWRFSLVGHEGFSLCKFTAADARGLNQVIRRTPTDNNPAHGDVVGKKTDGVRKAFKRLAEWVYRA